MSTLPDSFRLIFQDSPLGVAVVLQTGDGALDNAMLLYANPVMLQIMAHKSPDNFDFVSVIRDFCTDEDGHSLLPLARDPNDMKSIFVRISLPDDKSMWVEVRAQPTSIMGESAHFFWFTDVTETKELETIARREAAAADAAAQAKSAFLATMSHEIRTPMQTIFGLLELMKEEESIPRMLEMVGGAQASANGLLSILDDILDLAKVDAGKMELDMFEVPIRLLLNGLVESMDARRRENKLYLNAVFSDAVPDIVICDPKRLRQILTNLISNGLKFTETGGVTIRVTTSAKYITTDSTHVPLRFEIIDTGVGMTHDTASRLFQPFTQADNSTTRKFGGTGLGLSIAHRMVELMGGQIGVASQLNKGATFWFEIPTLITEAHTVVELPDLTGISVLAVDDNPNGQHDVHVALQHMKADVISVNSAAEAIALAVKRPFDVALIDYGLPGMDGLQVMKKLHELRPFIGLILYTVKNDYALLQACKFMGAKYLEKPTSRFSIGEAVKGAAKRVRPMSAKPQKLLVCEDNESVRDIIQRQLAKLDLTADFVENGQQGLDKIQAGEHTVIITDLHMPVMDGYGLVKAIRAHEQQQLDNGNAVDRLPVIAMTADVQLVHQQVYLEHGFDECLLKPVSVGQLRQLLIRWGVIAETSSDAITPDATADKSVKPPPVNETHFGVDSSMPVFDRVLAAQQFGAFDHDAIDMVKMFVQMSQTHIDQMHTAYTERDWNKLKNIAHSLKGAARSACCLHLGMIAENLQQDAIHQVVTEAHMRHLQDGFTRTAYMADHLTL